MSHVDVSIALTQLETADDSSRRELMTRLAWRPAWAIRSRRGALGELLKLFSKRT